VEDKALPAGQTTLLDLLESALLTILPKSSNPAQIQMDCRLCQTSAAPVANHCALAIIAGSRPHVLVDAELMKSFELLSGETYYSTAANCEAVTNHSG
jgi:hypothetical protein